MRLPRSTPLHLIFIILILSMLTGCAHIIHDGANAAHIVPADQVPSVVDMAKDKVQVMTVPVVETSECFPQMPVWVRRIDGVVQTQDVALYENRQTQVGYYRIAFIDHGRVGYCTPLGKVVISPQFDAGEIFQEGIAVVRQGEKYGYVDQFGKWLVKPKFDFAYGFWFGVGAAKLNDKFGLLDHAGQWIKEPSFPYMAAVGGGIEAHAADGEEGFLDYRGNFIKEGPLASFYHPPKRAP